MDATDTLRRFNRTYTQRIGALDDSFLGLGLPLGEARLVFEIGTAGAGVGELRERLGLDSGYLSRLLRGLEARGARRDVLRPGRPAAPGRRPSPGRGAPCCDASTDAPRSSRSGWSSRSPSGSGPG